MRDLEREDIRDLRKKANSYGLSEEDLADLVTDIYYLHSDLGYDNSLLKDLSNMLYEI